MKIFELLLDE